MSVIFRVDGPQFHSVGTAVGSRSKPAAIRCDNGPENISGLVQRWALQRRIRIDYIQPGKPQQNAYVERFNRTVRHEWLSQYLWADQEEV